MKKKQNRKKVFNFTTRTLRRYARELFKGITYPIEKYFIKGIRIPSHYNDLSTHGLRHIRATELLTKYRFDEIDLAIFLGWTLSASIKNVPKVIDRYIYMQWGRYFPKLLVPFTVN